MGEATNSSRGRATRQPIPPRRRGTTFYDRLEEARLRRRVVLAEKNSSEPQVPAAGPVIVRRDSGIVEAAIKAQANAEHSQNTAELTLAEHIALEINTEASETVPVDDVHMVVGPRWRLVIPGIAIGFLVAVLTIAWSDPSDVAVAPNTVLADTASSRTGPFQELIAQRLGKKLVPKINASTEVDMPQDVAAAPDSPALSQVPDASISTSSLLPTQIVSIAEDPSPAVQLESPTQNASALLVLSKVPPIRPLTLRTVPVQSAVFPIFNIVLHIPNGAQRSDATTLLGAAVGAGFEIADIQSAAFTISRTNVRYFHEEDAQAARVLANAIGGQFRDFTSFKPPPDPGVIEIWLKGEGTPAQTN